VLESATIRVEQAIARLRETEPKVHAYVHTLERQALHEARQLDSEAVRGPLHGIPFAVKEVFDIAGVETTGGSRALAGHVADVDAAAVQRLRHAGAVLMGTQVSHELTCGLDEPATRNPWNLACYPGGSSAGAGVSVAVGSAWFALGTDAAGSVRIPAAMTGVVGFKPSMGAVSKRGVIREASAPSIDNVGIVARNAALVADVFDAISFADPGDAQTLLHRPNARDAGLFGGRRFQGKRVVVLGEHTLAALDRIHECEPDVKSAFEAACELLRAAGAELVSLELPTLAQASGAVVAFFSQELAFAHRGLLRNGETRYHPQIREMLAATLSLPSSTLDDATAVRTRLLAEVEEGLSTVGAEVLLTPTTPRVAMRLASFRPEAELASLIPYTCGFNLTGNPAISLPNGTDRHGLPIGLQVVGRLCHDAALLRFSAALERIGICNVMNTPRI
jgi:aspartyl-tRNA(Asn)/glutamyl-tRNA(Gln) amidotransferase subunit A